MAKGQTKFARPASRSKSVGQSKSSQSRAASKDGPDATELLTEDHKKVQQLFKAFKKLREDDDVDEEKAEIVKQACQALTVHTQIEENIFYPAARGALDVEGDDLLNEAEVEHATAKNLIEELEEMEPQDELFDAKFIVLGEYIDHHVKEEQDELFPQLRKTELDLNALGAEMAKLMRELKAALQGDEDEDQKDEEESEEEKEDAGYDRQR